MLAVLAMALGLAWLTPVLAASAPAGQPMDELCSVLMGLDPAAARPASTGEQAAALHHHDACGLCAVAIGAPPGATPVLAAPAADYALPQGRQHASPWLVVTRQQARAPPLRAI
ncbi:MAG: hypothetical protein RLZZ584_3503 [Pseudomonadota bacterium]